MPLEWERLGRLNNTRKMYDILRNRLTWQCLVGNFKMLTNNLIANNTQCRHVV